MKFNLYNIFQRAGRRGYIEFTEHGGTTCRNNQVTDATEDAGSEIESTWCTDWIIVKVDWFSETKSNLSL